MKTNTVVNLLIEIAEATPKLRRTLERKNVIIYTREGYTAIKGKEASAFLRRMADAVDPKMG